MSEGKFGISKELLMETINTIPKTKEPVQLDGCFLFEQILQILNIPFTYENILNPKLYDELQIVLRDALRDLHTLSLEEMSIQAKRHNMGHLVFNDENVRQTIHTSNFLIDELIAAKEMILAQEVI